MKTITPKKVSLSLYMQDSEAGKLVPHYSCGKKFQARDNFKDNSNINVHVH